MKVSQFDHGFIEEVIAEPGGENLLTCWSCGTCAATCLVRRYETSFNPRLVIRQAGLGMREQTLSSAEIWQCSACDACYPRCPKKIHISDVMKAIRNVAIRHGYEAPGPVAVVDEDKCSGCAVCTRACPYGAIDRASKEVGGETRAMAQVNRNLCLHCGICVAACPSGAMGLETFSDQEIVGRIAAGGWLEQPKYLAGSAPAPRILAFVCQWTIRSDAEWLRLSGYGDRVRVVNLPCSGRVDPELILDALGQGADGVLVVGCKEGECHYQRGTFLGRSKVALIDQILEQMGISKARVSFAEMGSLDRFMLSSLIDLMSAELVASAAVTA
jgi:heterodisulfide reductase subunit C/coenzyme F420-reducing hydrogenase delta subunit